MTPEGKVKDQIKKLLALYNIMPAKDAGNPEIERNAVGWYYMPAATHFGVKGIPDFIGHYRGHFWAIEAKAPGKVPTGFQHLQINAVASTGGAVFVVDGHESLIRFVGWLRRRQNE